jgi:hypothetical protein
MLTPIENKNLTPESNIRLDLFLGVVLSAAALLLFYILITGVQTHAPIVQHLPFWFIQITCISLLFRTQFSYPVGSFASQQRQFYPTGFSKYALRCFDNVQCTSVISLGS